VDLTVERRLPAALRARTTGSVGSSVGDLPPQRWWNVGGWQTVRGTTAGTRRGDAFWMGRGELQLDRFRRVQPVGFVDAGWAGARGTLAESVRPGAMVRGAGAGVALMNGLARLDAARGLDAGARWRFAGYAVTRF
jgi:hemolysin activation/secretion protein